MSDINPQWQLSEGSWKIPDDHPLPRGGVALGDIDWKIADPLTCDLDLLLHLTGYFEGEQPWCGCQWDAQHRHICLQTPIYRDMLMQGWHPDYAREIVWWAVISEAVNDVTQQMLDMLTHWLLP